ncbi:hypothetical protein BDW68DRAFT_60438 [Aspergillus falconensis]
MFILLAYWVLTIYISQPLVALSVFSLLVLSLSGSACHGTRLHSSLNPESKRDTGTDPSPNERINDGLDAWPGYMTHETIAPVICRMLSGRPASLRDGL